MGAGLTSTADEEAGVAVFGTVEAWSDKVPTASGVGSRAKSMPYTSSYWGRDTKYASSQLARRVSNLFNTHEDLEDMRSRGMAGQGTWMLSSLNADYRCCRSRIHERSTPF